MIKPLEEIAAEREQAWLDKHGAHEYEKHDLAQEMIEELADCLNYANASSMPDDLRRLLSISLKQSYRAIIVWRAIVDNDTASLMEAGLEAARDLLVKRGL